MRFGHELQHERPHRVVEQNRTIVFVQHVEPEADGAFELAADRRTVLEVQLQKLAVNDRVLSTHIEVVRLLEMRQRLLQLGDEFLGGKRQLAVF